MMTRRFVILLAVVALLPTDVSAAKKIRIVTTIPDLADMARQVGGDLVDVTSLATGVENIHAVPMKPSFAVLINRADIVLLMGLEAEHAFLPALLEAGRNPRVYRDGPGYIDCSVYITPLEVPTRIDRALGDIHPMGNPHFNLDPRHGKDMLRAIADGLSRNYPDHVADLIERMRQAKVDLVVRELYYPARLAETVAQATGAKLIELPAMVGGVPEAKDYISFMDYTVRTLVNAVKGG